MSSKRTLSQRSNSATRSDSKKLKVVDSTNYLHETLKDSGLILKHPPEKCTSSSHKTIDITRNIKKNLEKHFEYPRNVSEFYTSFVKECHDLDIFKHYLFPNIVRITDEGAEEHPVGDSVIKILLSIPILQNKMVEYVFERAIDLAVRSTCGPWIKMILKCFSALDNIMDSEKLFTNLINLLDITSEKIVRLEIITAIPDIIGDQEHQNIAAEMSRILSRDHDLVPAVLQCLSYLCLSEEQYDQLQKKTLNILMTVSKCNYFPLFVEFLLIPNRLTDTSYLEAVQGLRNALGWPSLGTKPQDIASSQILTATAIRNTMVSSKVICKAWLKVITNCKLNTDHNPIDFIIMLILFSTSEEKQCQVENIIRKQIKMGILRENLLDEAFQKFKPILKDYLKNLIELANSLLKTNADPEVESFASHLYTLMFSELDDCCQTILAELLQLSLDSKQCVMNVLFLLNNVARKDMSLLKPLSIQMLTLLDRTNNMPLSELRAVMNLLCGLAYSYENSIIRDDLHMIIRKQLSSCDSKTKVQGILAGIHAVKYLMANTDDNDDENKEMPGNISYGSVTYLAEGDLREAAQIIELISCSTKQNPDMVAFFYDELSKIISSASYINKHFISWLTEAVTNDLQQNFVVDTIEEGQIRDLKLVMQYCLNSDSEMDDIIAVNIAGLTLQPKSDICVAILSPLFQLAQTLHSKQQDDNLSSIDALLGCPIVMPNFEVDLVEHMEQDNVTNILDCLVHCVNWFRELLNAFSTQDDEALHCKILRRVVQIEELELVICEILVRSKISYKPPETTFNIKKYTGEQTERRAPKVQSTKQKQKKSAPDDTALPETFRTQTTQNAVKNKQDAVHNINFRQLNLNLLQLFKLNMSTENESETNLTQKTLRFLLRCVNQNIENILISKIKKKSFLSKQEDIAYDPQKAEETAKAVGEILPKLMDHLLQVTNHIEQHINPNSQNESEMVRTAETIEYIKCLENIYNILTIFFKWIGFRNHHNALLKSSLRTVANSDSAIIILLKDLLLAVAKKFEEHEKYCLQLSTAVSLIELVKAIQNHTDNKIVRKILKKMAENFMCQQWKTIDGLQEKGLQFNQSVDRLLTIYFVNNEIISLKNLSLQLTSEINNLKSRNDTLTSMKCINKSNFTILYRNMGTALYESTKSSLTKGLTNSEHLSLWKDVASTLKYMSDIAKTLDNRNNLSAFFKKSLPVLKLFMSQGMPILELQFKNETQEVLEILNILQKSTRFLQSLCCHSRLKNDCALMSKVPLVKQLLETLLYKVKAVLVANKCSEAFLMGNLKNKNIHGEVISTQQSIASEESLEDCDEQLPEDDDSNDSDEDMLDTDSKRDSDIV
ncbi:Fanconi anemia, complementation group D2 [Operophtera brumata]|uniref:Fanconi anemia, complementation group D2 n=1 Tax=Operophtera brumata TaxID=104452 RepID=A0A0L7KV59_OPEBR|nr:Fanconi anemia, complementation group D2 [Operophtera brumata]